MGTLTLADLRAQLLFDLKGRTDTLTTDGMDATRQNMYVNAGYLWLTHPSVFRHRELQLAYTIPLVAATNSYAFTPNAGVVITGIRYVSHVAAATDNPTARRVKMYPKDEQWFQERTLTTGAPRDYAVRGSSLLVSPVPTATEAGQVLVVGAWREPAVLAADGSVTVLSTLWDEIVVLASRWRAELHLGYRDLAEATKLDLVGLLNEYKDFDQLHGEDWGWTSEVRVESHMESA